MRKFLCLAAAVIVLTSSLVAQEGKTSPETNSSNQKLKTTKESTSKPPATVFKPQQVSLLFSGETTKKRILLTLNNNHSVLLPVTLRVFTTSGQSVQLPSRQLLANESRLIELSPILDKAGLTYQELGYLDLQYSGLFLGLGAQLTLYPDGVVGVDSPRSLANDFVSPQRQAAFWLSRGAKVTLALTNMSVDSLIVHLKCGALTKDLALGGHATNIEELSIADLLQHKFQGDQPADVATGCELQSEGDPSALRATGIIRRNDRYDAPIRFYDSLASTSPNLSAPYVRTSAQTHIAVLNVSNEPVQFSPVIREATLETPKEITLPQYTVEAHKAIQVQIDPALALLRRQGVATTTLTIQSVGSKGALVGALTQIDSDGLIEDVPFRSANVAKYAAGAYPLRWDKDYTNHISVTNTADVPLIARALITARDVNYSLPQQTIAPGRTMVYDVDKLRTDQIKDPNGNLLPKDAVVGKFMWFEIGMGRSFGLMGRNPVTSRDDNRRSSFSCGMACEYTKREYPTFIDQSPFAYTPFGTGFGSRIVDRTYTPYGQTYDLPYDFSNAPVTSNGPQILSYSADPNSNTSYAATTVAGGSVIAAYTDVIDQPYVDIFGDCTSPAPEPFQNSGGAGVQIPTSTQFNVLIEEGQRICPPDSAGWDMVQNRYIADQLGNVIVASMHWDENDVIDPSNNGLGITSIEQNDVDTTNGFYSDHVWACSTACPGTAQSIATQNQTVTLAGQNFTLVPNSIALSCSKMTINGKP